MLLRFFLLVLILSFGELYLLVYVASQTSFLLTFTLCLLTGLVGGAMVRRQGLSTWVRIQQSTASGRLPAHDIVAGLILLVTGTLLLTPGFITDVVAFLLLVPPLRALAAAGLVRFFKHRIVVMGGNFSGPAPQRGGPRRQDGHVVIDVEAEEVD